ncbi:MAG TPA: NAD(P)H-binding protein [Beutenbergiaceae bacterium]|nr:NAD(P)H-binding protein [Beutenbergiaceae bacterium]
MMTILVTGATGNIGRKVVDHLLDGGAQQVRALTVNPHRAALPPEVEVVRGYVGDPGSLDGVFEGVEQMYLAPVPDTAGDVASRAAAAGVEHIVDLAGAEGSWWYAVEEGVEASGAAWTHLEPGEFMENTSVWAEQIRTTGQVRDAFGHARNAMIALDDVAAVAAAVLLGAGRRNTSYPLTGPESLSKVEKVQRLAAGLGRRLEFIEVSRSEAIAQLEPQMGEYAEWYVGTAQDADADWQPVVPTVAELTGRPAITLSQWAGLNARQFTEPRG